MIGSSIRHSSRSYRRFPPSWMAALFALALSGSRVQAQEVTFWYNPPDGTTYFHTEKTTLDQDVPAKGHMKEVHTRRYKVFIKKVGSRFLRTETLISSSTIENSKPTPDSMKVLLNLPETEEVDFNGHLVAVRGLQEEVMRIKKALKTSGHSVEANQLNIDAVQAISKDAWQDEIGQFFGKKATIGQTWTADDQILLPTTFSLAPAKATIRLVSQEKCGDADCVRLHIASIADPDLLQAISEDAINQELARSSNAANTGPIKLYDLKATEETDALVDPATLLFRSVKTQILYQMNLDLGGQVTLPITIQGNAVDTYDYNVAKSPARPTAKKPAAKAKTIKKK